MRNEISQLLTSLISIPSVSGNEKKCLDALEDVLAKKGWKPQRIPVVNDRYNLLATFGVPRVIFTTHIDVVPAPEHLFSPQVSEGKIFGRGACDAKGVIVAMMAACHELLNERYENFGLLFVVGEEDDGIGAKTAAQALRDKGIQFLINGEPTEGKLIRAHKGMVDAEIYCSGVACHSGYPHLGEDANMKLVGLINKMIGHNFGEDPILGKTTINVAKIRGGVATNVVSPSSELLVSFRTITSSDKVIAELTGLVGDAAKLQIHYRSEPARLMTVEGFDTEIAAFCTDIPNFEALNAKALLYGPGSIHVAHTDKEYVSIDDLNKAVDDYKTLFKALESL